MISNWIWDIATSSPILIGLIVAGALSWAVGRFGFVFPQYALVGRLLAPVAFLSLMFLVGFRVADERADKAQLQRDLDFAQVQLANQRAATADKERLRREAQAKADDLDKKVGDYEERLAKLPVGACALDDADIDGLRRIAR